MSRATSIPRFSQTSDVYSADGTKIVYYTMGQGPSVVVVPGALSLASDYITFAAALADHGFAVHSVDRRGHGKSGPQGADYSIEKECDDIEAVRQKTQAEYLVGHSFGGLIALEAGRNNPSIKKIAVYEPGVSIDNSIPSGWFNEYQTNLDHGKPVDAFVVFIRAMQPAFRYLPKWYFKLLMPIIFGEELKKMQGQLPANLYEHKEAVRLNNTYRNYSQVAAKVLFMAGGKSKNAVKEVERVAKIMEDASIKTFPKFDHFGIDKGGPKEIADEVARFLKLN